MVRRPPHRSVESYPNVLGQDGKSLSLYLRRRLGPARWGGDYVGSYQTSGCSSPPSSTRRSIVSGKAGGARGSSCRHRQAPDQVRALSPEARRLVTLTSSARCRGAASAAACSGRRRPLRRAPLLRCAASPRPERASRERAEASSSCARVRAPISGTSAVLLGQHPGDRELRRACALLGGDLRQRIDEPLVLLRGSRPAKRGRYARKSPGAAACAPREQAAREDAVERCADAELARARGRSSASGPRLMSEYSICRSTIGWTAVRAADRVDADLGEADVRARSRPSPCRRSRRSCPRWARSDRGARGGRCRCRRRRGA